MFGAGGIHSIQKLPCLIARAADDAGNWRAVHMDVEYVQKNAEALESFAIHLYGCDACDLSVRGGDHGSGFRRDDPVGISKEPEKKPGQKNWNHGPDGGGQPSHEYSSREQHGPVVVAIT